MGVLMQAMVWMGLPQPPAWQLVVYFVCIGMFGVEAASPGRPGRNNFEVHHVCRDMGFTHMEGLVNLDRLVGKGRFRFIGFPLKIKRGTGSPIRAVAWLDE